MENKPYKIVIVYGTSSYHISKTLEIRNLIRDLREDIDVSYCELDNLYLERLIEQKSYDKLIFVHEPNKFEFLSNPKSHILFSKKVLFDDMKLIYFKKADPSNPLFYDATVSTTACKILGKQKSSKSLKNFLSDIPVYSKKETSEDKETQKFLDVEEKAKFEKNELVAETKFDKRLLLFF